MKQAFKYIVTVVSLFGFINVASFPVQAHEGHEHVYDESNSENYEETNSLEFCGFPQEYETLLSYAAEDAVWPELQDAPLELTTPIPAGAYHITAGSFDSHSTKHNPTQPNEQWQFWAYSGDTSTPSFYSRYTDDLPDDQDYNTSELQSYVYFEQPITHIRYVHYAFSKGLEINNFNGMPYDEFTEEQKAQVMWNSVQPSCMEFEPMPVLLCSALTAAVDPTNKWSYTFNAAIQNLDEMNYSVQFNFGDGEKEVSMLPSAQHTFASYGNYDVYASVMNDDVVYATCQVSVSVAPSTGTVLGTNTSVLGGTSGVTIGK